MLTQEQLDILKAPFAPGDVSFKQTFAYGTEDAIADRIEMVDPSWTFERLSIEARDKYVTATFRLTICGVWRDGVGMELLSSNADPDKSAATDALKRAARLFGIGRYFQSLPDNVKDWKSYETWYKSNVGTPTQKPTPVAQKPNPFSGQQPSTSNLLPDSVYRVNKFQVNLSKGRVPQPYLIFAIGETEYAYSYTRQPFAEAGYDVTDWKNVGNHEMPCPAEITVEKHVSKDGKVADQWTVKSVRMIDLFAEAS